MADSVIPLPTRSVAPVINPPRRGRLPKAIPNIRRERRKREFEEYVQKSADLAERKKLAEEEVRKAAEVFHKALWKETDVMMQIDRLRRGD